MKWLSDVVCDNINNLYNFKEFRDGGATGTKNRYFKRNQEMIDDDGAADRLFQDQWWKSDFAKLIMVRQITLPMFLKYCAEEKDPLNQEVGGFYNWHMDNGVNFESGNEPVRKISMSLLLNHESEFDGGDLELCEEGKVAPLKQGHAIFFASFLNHRVKPVTRGTRKSLVMWFGGTPFK